MKPILWTLVAAMIAAFVLASPAAAQEGGAPELLVNPQHQPQEGVSLAPLSEKFVPQIAAPKPLTMVNYVAMQRAAERRARLDAQAWYGVSNLRPTRSVTPFTGDYVEPYNGFVYAPYQWPPNYYAPSVIYHTAR